MGTTLNMYKLLDYLVKLNDKMINDKNTFNINMMSLYLRLSIVFVKTTANLII